jgi:hypothetical protein
MKNVAAKNLGRFFFFWGCGLKSFDGHLFGLSAIPALRFGAAPIPQPFGKKSLFSFFCGGDWSGD